MIIPKEKENIKLNIDIIKPSNFFFFLVCAKILIDENIVKNTVKILLKISKQLNIYLIYLLNVVDNLFLY